MTSTNIDRKDPRSLLLLYTKPRYLSFNVKICTQTDGLAMDSTLGPVLLGIFITYLECDYS